MMSERVTNKGRGCNLLRRFLGGSPGKSRVVTPIAQEQKPGSLVALVTQKADNAGLKTGQPRTPGASPNTDTQPTENRKTLMIWR